MQHVIGHNSIFWYNSACTIIKTKKKRNKFHHEKLWKPDLLSAHDYNSFPKINNKNVPNGMLTVMTVEGCCILIPFK